MCGISGIVDLSGRGIDRDAVITLRDSLAHRGPDDVGSYFDEYAGLGQRRLSIIDLSPAGRQPMSNEDGSVQVMCNGEIYNYRALKSQLIDAGHRFSSGSDCETLAHGYEQWGMEGLLARVKGMFSIAVWDRDKRTLWLARDRLGVKPLYFKTQDGRLAFASEPHGLYAGMELGPDNLDRESLDYYLSFGYVPPDRAIVSGIQKMPPGHVLRYDTGGMACWRYWDVQPSTAADRMGFGDQVDAVDELLKAAVVRRLESDVPLGSFLSAGIDSGIVSAMAAEALDEPLRTFTVGFENDTAGVDERPLALQIADRYGTDHHELFVGAEDAGPLPQLIWNAGEPFADVSVLPSHQISRLARSEITVALT
ncbi:MAG: asparagine synthase (glutamine-hydrolyzing), partial [SAR202 cluster bacterium]|nr:asparagine synthase (glutamine-hydrolyzing) [SAR202 cluster bacterium]